MVLALCLGIGWAVSLVVVVMEPDRLTGPGAVLLYVTTGVLVGALVSWLARPHQGEEEHDE
jgi:hypothetical protein